MARASDFDRIVRSLVGVRKQTGGRHALVLGDALETLRTLPSQSTSLVLTDPPYHTTKKSNIYGDDQFKRDEDFVEWMSALSVEWHRVLKPNGSLFCFCSSKMAARLDMAFSSRFNVLSSIVWTKPNDPGFDGWKGKMNKGALRSWYPHSERILFAEPAQAGNLRRSPLGIMLRDARVNRGLTTIQLAERIGAYGRVNHGGAVANWEAGRNVPSAEQYGEIRAVLNSDEHNVRLPEYWDAVRAFRVDKETAFTDVWDFPSVRPYRGKHPAEKPLDLLEHAIKSTTLEGDIVLDCFAGSGSALAATLKTNRRALGVEIDPRWFASAARIVSAYDELAEGSSVEPRGGLAMGQNHSNVEQSLFSLLERTLTAEQ